MRCTAGRFSGQTFETVPAGAMEQPRNGLPAKVFAELL
jgi:hypothetical protein